MNFRIGHGYDLHRLVEDRRLILGGVDIPFEKGKEIVFNALKPLGDTYINDLKKAFDGISISQRDSINALYRGRDVAQEVLEGKSLLLPNNLFIWASMNTSDRACFR